MAASFGGAFRSGWFLLSQSQATEDWRALAAWLAARRPAPPPHLAKQLTLRRYAAEFGLHVLVETGTYLGQMVEAMRPHFQQLFSIELSQELFEAARARFARVPNVHLLHGDSATALRHLLERMHSPALFWLDGHYSGGITARGSADTPVVEELRAVLDSPRHGDVVIIDDARMFGSDPAYPSVEDLGRLVHGWRPAARVAVKDDRIRITGL